MLNTNIHNTTIMRKRINANAVCSSENYAASKRVHQTMLKAKHNSFHMFAASEKCEELSIKRQIVLDNMPVVVKVFGKEITITKREYEEHYKALGFKIIK